MLLRLLSSRNGVSFPEVLVAVGILGFALTGLLNGMVSVIDLNKVTRNTTIALSHGEYVLETIRSTPYAAVSEAINSGRWTLRGAKISDEGLLPLKNETVTTSCSGSGPLVVSVAVRWEDSGGRKRSLELSTIEAGL